MVRLTTISIFLILALPVLAQTETHTEPAKKTSSESKIAGYRLSEVTPGGLSDKMGLRNGDTILEVNGKKATQPEIMDLLKLSQEPQKAGKSVVLKIKREGKIQVLNYTFQ